jgi:hypothetical protein
VNRLGFNSLMEEDKKVKLSKLPKWAQDELHSRNFRIDQLEKQVAELSSQHPGSNVAIWGGMREDEITLPPDSGIVFYVEDESENGCMREHIEVRHDRNRPGTLHVSASYGGLFIMPSAANSARIMVDRF